MHKIGTSFFLLALTLGAAHAAPNAATAADVGPVGLAAKGDRTLDVKAGTRYLNVRNGETVTIRQGERSVTWSVQVASNVNVVPLSRVLPQGGDGRDVLVYIAPGQPYLDF